LVDEILLQEMGKRIYLRRKALHLTQEQVAEKMNVSIQMISNLELGNKAIRPENLKKLCQTLQISADYLLMGETVPSSHAILCEKIHQLPQEFLPLIDQIVDLCLQKSK